MKKIIITLLFSIDTYLLFAQTIAKDDTNNGQMKRMVYKKWDDWSGYNQLVALIYWDIIHEKYKNGGDLRPYKLGGQFEQNYASLTLQEENDHKIMDTANKTVETHVATYTSMAGGALDIPYSIYFKNKFHKLTTEVTDVVEQQIKTNAPVAYGLIQGSTDYENYLEFLVIENDRIQNIHHAYLDKGERIQSYIDIQTAIEAANKVIEKKITAIFALSKIPTIQEVQSSSATKSMANNTKAFDAASVNNILKNWNF
ncbi:MAG: hypothetical protein JST58_04840 [Bacteroidetes bacterium]|nr:hypothetical protein [Bacteroidota bacterium]